MKRVIAVLSLGTLALVGCGEDPPELPPEDSMILPEFLADRSNAQSVNAGNVLGATVAVGAVTLGINLALVTPRLIFAGTLAVEPEQDGGDWVWDRDFTLLGFSTQLRGNLDGALNTQVIVNGEIEGKTLNDFVWFTGEHNANDGTWTFFDPETEGQVLDINWTYNSETDKSVEFLNTRSGADEEGDSVTYTLNGDTATMALSDARDADGNAQSFSVEWNVADGSGKITLADNTTLCWDTVENSQTNIDCP